MDMVFQRVQMHDKILFYTTGAWVCVKIPDLLNKKCTGGQSFVSKATSVLNLSFACHDNFLLLLFFFFFLLTQRTTCVYI
jgi:hypothetical protein